MRESGTTLVPALRLAVRDLRGAVGGFAVFLACIALGVAAIAAVADGKGSMTTRRSSLSIAFFISRPRL